MSGDEFPGTLYDGDGMRLAGDGPDYTPALNQALPFKVVLRQYGVTDEAGELSVGDRLWLLPDTFGTPPALPEDVLDELADALRPRRAQGRARGQGRGRGCVRARRAAVALERG